MDFPARTIRSLSPSPRSKTYPASKKYETSQLDVEIYSILKDLNISKANSVAVLDEIKNFIPKLKIFDAADIIEINEYAANFLECNSSDELAGNYTNDEEVDTLINTIKRYMVCHEKMLAESKIASYYPDLNDDYISTNSHVLRLNRINDYLNSPQVWKNRNQEKDNQLENEHRIELVAAHYSSQPKNILDYVKSQQANDYKKRERYLNEKAFLTMFDAADFQNIYLKSIPNAKQKKISSAHSADESDTSSESSFKSSLLKLSPKTDGQAHPKTSPGSNNNSGKSKNKGCAIL